MYYVVLEPGLTHKYIRFFNEKGTTKLIEEAILYNDKEALQLSGRFFEAFPVHESHFEGLTGKVPVKVIADVL